jgi:nitrate/nitrite transporter NarK
MTAIILLSGLLSDAMIRRGFREDCPEGVHHSAAGHRLLGRASRVRGGQQDSGVVDYAVAMRTGISAPNTWTLTQAVCTKQMVGTVSGIQNFGGNLGGILAPALTGYIAHKTHSFSLALDMTGGVLVIGMAAYAVLVRAQVGPGG